MDSAWTVWQLFATGRNEMRKSSFRCLIGKKSFSPDLKMVHKKIASIIFLSGLILHCHVQYSQSYYSQTQNHVLHFSPAPLRTPMWAIRILEDIAMLRFLKYPLPFDFFSTSGFQVKPQIFSLLWRCLQDKVLWVPMEYGKWKMQVFGEEKDTVVSGFIQVHHMVWLLKVFQMV